MITPIIITYIGISVLVAFLAIGRRISFAGAFFTSVFMSPLVGLVAILNSDKNIKVKYYTTRYSCPECKYEYTEQKEYCSFCKKKGITVKLEPKQILLLE